MNNRLRSFAALAENLARDSKCEQIGVAALICDAPLKQIYSIGVNGGPSHGPQCLCALPGKYGCVHAEMNALIKCNVDTEGKVMICTLSPCVSCAAAIINAGITKFYYINTWKDTAGLILLENSGIICECIV